MNTIRGNPVVCLFRKKKEMLDVRFVLFLFTLNYHCDCLNPYWEICTVANSHFSLPDWLVQNIFCWKRKGSPIDKNCNRPNHSFSLSSRKPIFGNHPYGSFTLHGTRTGTGNDGFIYIYILFWPSLDLGSTSYWTSWTYPRMYCGKVFNILHWNFLTL